MQNKIARHLLNAAGVVCFLLVFSYSTSPISALDYAYDSAFYRLVGSGMLKGMLPYRDFFEMKGPWFYLIEALGQLICEGRTGIFILQCINLFAVAETADAIFKLFGMKRTALCKFCCAFLLAAALQAGNLTEEFSLLPLMLSVYVFARYIRNGDSMHQPGHAFIYGLCAGFLLFVRANNAYLTGALALAAAVNVARRRLWRNLLVNTAALLGGIVCAATPVLVYCAAQGLLSDMFDTVFGFGMLYSRGDTVSAHIIKTVKYGAFRLVPLMLCPIMAFVLKRSFTEKTAAVLAAAAGFAAVSMGGSGSMFLHYYIVLIPAFVLTLCMVRSGRRFAYIVLAFALLLQTGDVWNAAVSAGERLIFRDEYNVSEAACLSAEVIPPEDRDSVYCYNLQPAWYTYTGIYPCIRYCGWVNTYIRMDASIEAELEKLFNETQPRWLVLPVAYGKLPGFLEVQIESAYQPVYTDDTYAVLRRI